MTDLSSTTPREPDEGLPPETVLADLCYVIEEPIGAGGFGTVYRARQRPLERHVAVKVLPRAAQLDPGRIARFEYEAALFQRFEHPNAVKLIDYGFANGAPFIVMELLRGESLASLVEREGPQSEARTARVATDVLKALMEAHAVGIVHRDIKPANVFITRPAGDPFFVKLLDFGIAKEAQAEGAASTLRPGEVGTSSPALTGAGQAMGTPRYMAPEQVFGGSVGPAADIYALGLTLAEMLSGRPLFGSESVVEILALRASDEPTALPERVRASRLGAVVARAVSKSSLDRYPSAEAMLSAVEALGIDDSRAATAGSGSIQVPVDGSTRLDAFEATVATPLASQRSPRSAGLESGSRMPRIRTLAMIGGPLAVLGVGAVVVALSSRGTATHPSAVATASISASAPRESPHVSKKETPESLPRVGSILVTDEPTLLAAIKPLGFHASAWRAPHPSDQQTVVNVENESCAGSITLISAPDDATLERQATGFAVMPPRYPFVRDQAHRRALSISVTGLDFAGERCTVALYHALVGTD